MIRQCCNATGSVVGELVPRERELVAIFQNKSGKGSHKAFEIVMDADKFRYFNESGAKI